MFGYGIFYVRFVRTSMRQRGRGALVGCNSGTGNEIPHREVDLFAE